MPHTVEQLFILLHFIRNVTSLTPLFSFFFFLQVEKKIGQGQFSVVYRARNLVDGQIVALKKIQVSGWVSVHMYIHRVSFRVSRGARQKLPPIRTFQNTHEMNNKLG